MSGFAEVHQQSQALLESDDPGAAAKAERLWRVFLLDPACSGDDRALSFTSLARTVAERGRFKEAVHLAWEGVELASSAFAKVAAWSDLTAVLHKGRRNDRAMEAVSFIDEFCALFPDVADAYMPFVLVGRARLLFLDGRIDEAAGVCVRATISADNRGQARAEAYGLRSDILEAMGDREGALISAVRGAAASTAPKCKTEAYLKIFRLHLEAKEFEEATEFAAKAMEVVPAASRRMVAAIVQAYEDLRMVCPEAAAALQAALLSPTA